MGKAPLALITGGSRGIGAAIAAGLAARGHRLALVARDAGGLQSRAESLRADGAEVHTFACDLRAVDALEGLLADVERAAGPVEVLVNNAGTAGSARVEDTTDAALEEAFALHLKAPLRLIRALLPAMRARGSGCLVQVASAAGLRGYPFVAAYAAAKHAMVGLTRVLIEELRSTRLRAWAVCPGFVDTELTREAAREVAARGRHTEAEAMAMFAAMNEGGRMLEPGEVAAFVVRLCVERPASAVYNLETLPPTEV